MSGIAATAGLREVRLYGHLRARFGRSHWLAVASPAEAVRALCVLVRGFRETLLSYGGPGYRVMVGEGVAAHERDEPGLAVSCGPGAVIRIAPVIHARKRQGLAQVIGGAILVVAGTYFFGGPTLVQMGIGLMLGGAIQMLSPQRNGSGSKAKQETSQALAGPVNVSSPGGPVPLIIGRMLVGSVTISAGLSTDQAAVTVATGSTPTLPGDEPADWLNIPGY